MILRRIWPIEMAPCISEVGVNVCGISFRSKSFLRKATKEGPWSIMGCCLRAMVNYVMLFISKTMFKGGFGRRN